MPGGSRGEAGGGRCDEQEALPKLILCYSLSIIKLDMGRLVLGRRGAWTPPPPFTVHCRKGAPLPPRVQAPPPPPTLQQEPRPPGHNFPLVFATLGRVDLFRRDLWRTPEDILSFPPVHQPFSVPPPDSPSPPPVLRRPPRSVFDTTYTSSRVWPVALHTFRSRPPGSYFELPRRVSRFCGILLEHGIGWITANQKPTMVS